MDPVDVVVVGAGMSGVACARGLAAAGCQVEVLDRGRGIGGRMAVRRTPDGHVVDIGASYLTAADDRFESVVRSWLDRGQAREWTDTFHVSDGTALVRTTTGPVRYAAAHGLRSLVEDLAGGLRVRHPAVVTSVRPTSDARWTVDVEDGPQASADAVVLAMPDPQADRLLPASLRGAFAPAGPWPWDPVIAVAAQWDHRWWPDDIDGVFVNAPDDGLDGPPSSVRRDAEGDSTADGRPPRPARVAWIADDGRRRGDGAHVLVVHTTPGTARPWLHDPDRAAGPVLRSAARALGVDNDPPEPLWTHVQRWSLAHPLRQRPAPPYGRHPAGLAVCGDAWGERSRVEAAWLSGTRLADALARRAEPIPLD